MTLSLLRLPEVSRRIGLKRAQIYRLVASGQLPAPVRLASTKSVAWRSDEIAAWIEGCERASAKAPRHRIGAPQDAA